MKQENISRERLRSLVSRWQRIGESGHTYYLPPGQVPPKEVQLPEEVSTLLGRSETGVVLFWSLAEARLLLPPFPVERAADYHGWQGGPLHSILDRSRRILVLLLRLGGFSVGIFDGQQLLSSKTGSPFVKGRHRKGGSSSARFARRREGQARHLFDKACEALRGQVEGYEGQLDNFILGGDRLTLLAFEKQCPLLQTLSSIRLRRILDVPDPRLNVLKATPRLIYTSRLITFTPDMPADGTASFAQQL